MDIMDYFEIEENEEVNHEQMQKVTDAFNFLKSTVKPEQGKVTVYRSYSGTGDVHIKIEISGLWLIGDTIEKFAKICNDSYAIRIEYSDKEKVIIYITISDVFAAKEE